MSALAHTHVHTNILIRALTHTHKCEFMYVTQEYVHMYERVCVIIYLVNSPPPQKKNAQQTQDKNNNMVHKIYRQMLRE